MAMNSDNLGDEMYEAAMSIAMTQGTKEGEDIGRLRMRKMAKAIIDHISDNATIGILSTSELAVSGQSPHIHSTRTQSATGKIS